MAQAPCPASSLLNKSLHALEKVAPPLTLLPCNPTSLGKAIFPQVGHILCAQIIRCPRDQGRDAKMAANDVFGSIQFFTKKIGNDSGRDRQAER